MAASCSSRRAADKRSKSAKPAPRPRWQRTICRIVGCYEDPSRRLPLNLADERGVSFWQPSLDDPRLLTSRHIVFNLSRPEKSVLLLAPLAKEAGGWELCRDPKNGSSAKVFANRSDADYQALLAMVTAGTDFLAEHKRFDMPGFVPRADWVRELKRYGVLPDEVNPATSATFTPSRRSIGNHSGINRNSRRRRASRTIQRMD